ncbi:Retrovirus-related Pol polyprotein from type-1 retrotransposable element R2, partial [Toxocara canis]
QLDEQQPREQAGFRRNFSVVDHLFTINQILEKCNEYKLPLCIAFVDYERAFDSVEINAVLQALVDQGISSEYASLLKEANSGRSTEITLFDRAVRIPLRRGVKQGDIISPKLFTACLEMVKRKIKWKGGIIIDGEKLNHLRFADDIVLFASNSTELTQMLRELENESKKVGITVNPQK